MTVGENNIKTPSHISKEFLKKALENGLKTKNIEIEDFTTSMASGGGENYTSDIYRISVKYKMPEKGTQEISLIMKAIQTGGESEVLNKMGVFNIEKNMYLEIIPQLEEVLGNNSIMAPKCFYALEHNNLLVLQDLKALGYKLGDRHKGLDEQHCEVVLKKIGQFHGASMVLAKKNPESVTRFDKGIFNEFTKDSKIMKGLFLANLEHLINIIDTWPDYEAITVKLKKIHSNFFDRSVELLKPKEGELRVLNHGDLWVNNFMFKYDDDNAPSDVAFIDLQISVYGSLGIDINYFLNISSQLDVLKMKRYDLLKVYYDSLKSTLRKLKYSPIPSWDDVRKEIRAKEFYGFIAFFGILPLVAMDRDASKDNSLETFRDENLMRKKLEIMFSSKRMQETMKYALNRFDELGIFDS